MLQIRDISKEYRTGDLVQKALDHVSLNLRDNEFVAILGPSGSGKTTLLNIIGGLDRYDSGDLVINGISTKKYKDKDWDSYRNHTIGFVFQSYNLISHQTILANVELALTISGISRSERTQRALEALKKVGLAEQAHKKPNQLSGGQMQRVAIARALVNDPDILLADEPTGALDSETSLQVMELLKEVADDRLVVMVTHNPELAEQYATRIVRLKDGKIIDDSDPCVISTDEEPVYKNMGKSSMSFLTALSLSFNNLLTKKARTILVAFAGSIGIIGIALILALSNGVNQYIRSTEEETLSEYPLTIQSTSFDLSSVVMAQTIENEETFDVKERPMLNNMLSRTRSNDLKSLKEYLDTSETVQKNVQAIEYTYSISPLIYRIDDKGYRQINPDTSFTSVGLGTGSGNSLMSLAMSTDVFFALPRESSLYINQYDVKAGHWPENTHECVLVLLNDGSIPDIVLYSLGLLDANELDEMIESFTNEENFTPRHEIQHYAYEDFLGIRFKLVSPAQRYSYDSEYDVWVDKSEDTRFMRNLIQNGEDLTIVGVVKRKEDSDFAMLSTGIGYDIRLQEEAVTMSVNSPATKAQLADKDKNIFSGKDFGEEEQNFSFDSLFSVDESAFSNLIQIDASKLQFDTSAFNSLGDMDLSGLINPEDMANAGSSIDFGTLLSKINIKIKTDQADDAMGDLLRDYLQFAAKDPSTDISALNSGIEEFLRSEDGRNALSDAVSELIKDSGIDTIDAAKIQEIVSLTVNDFYAYLQENEITIGPDTDLNSYFTQYMSERGTSLIQDQLNGIISELPEIGDDEISKLSNQILSAYQTYAENNGKPQPDKIRESFTQYLASPEGGRAISSAVSSIVDTEDLQRQVNQLFGETMSGYSESMNGIMQKMMTEIGNRIGSIMQDSVSQFARDLPNAIRFNPSALENAFSMNMDQEEIEEMFMSMMSSQGNSYDGNLRLLGYADLEKPVMISIYPNDFDAKNVIIDTLDSYNRDMEEIDPDRVIRYTDTVGLLMSSVTNIVDTISYVLIAFVAISLVVSSIMIGVITYISVLERNKEIGILRAIGASKRNISEVFNAETFIIGLLAGLFGIGITRLLLIPGNMLIHALSDNKNINAVLPWNAAVILVILSIILTLIGGIIPSRKAAKSDPVTALRTE